MRAMSPSRALRDEGAHRPSERTGGSGLRLLPYARPNLYGRRRAARSLLPHPAARSHEDTSDAKRLQRLSQGQDGGLGGAGDRKMARAVRKGFQDWGEAFHLARGGDPAARDLLLKLVDEPATPAVARATALIEAQRLPSISVEQAASRSLEDPDPLVRIAALRAQSPSAPLDQRWRRAGPLLSDPIRAVRIEAASLLADQPADALANEDRVRLEAAWAEYEASQKTTPIAPRDAPISRAFCCAEAKRTKRSRNISPG